MGEVTGFDPVIRNWRKEIEVFVHETSKKAIFNKHIRLTVDKQIVKKHKNRNINLSLRFLNNKKRRLTRKIRHSKKKYQQLRKKNEAAIIGPKRLKLKLSENAYTRWEERTRKRYFYSEDLNKTLEYETHDLIHLRYPTWRLPWIRKLWYLDKNYYGYVYPTDPHKYNPKKRQDRRRTLRKFALFKRDLHKVANKRVIEIFSHRLDKMSFILNKYIKRHSAISEELENVKLRQIHPNYLSWQVLNFFLLNMYII